MRVFGFVFRMLATFAAVFGVGVTLLVVVITGGVGRRDVALVKDGFGYAYVTGLKEVEYAARRLRGDYCQTRAERPVDCT